MARDGHRQVGCNASEGDARRLAQLTQVAGAGAFPRDADPAVSDEEQQDRPGDPGFLSKGER